MKFLSCAGLFSFTSEVRNKITFFNSGLGFLLASPSRAGELQLSGCRLCFILVPQGGLEVTVCIEEPLLSAAQLSDGNLLSVTLEAAYSVPDAFVPTGPPQNYMACLQVPAAGEVRIGPGMVRGVLAATKWIFLLHHTLWNKSPGPWGV